MRSSVGVLCGCIRVTYKEINVWAFVVIWPILTIILIVLVVYQQIRIRQLQKKLSGDE